MEFKSEVAGTKKLDMGMLALVYAVAGEEEKSEYIRALAQLKHEQHPKHSDREMAVA